MNEIKGYRLIRPIGSGGMGVIYEAEQASPRRMVALKVLRGDFFAPGLARRLEFEAQVLGLLRHPGIAQIYEAGSFQSETGEQPFFAMEYVRGIPLTTYASAGRLSVRQKLELLIKVCDAVEHAHQKGIVHRDLKPENILVEEDGQPKILDFGLARAADSDIRALTTCRELGEIVGTVLYMSPEQTEGRSDLIDARSDVYTLGVLGYELLTGEFPHVYKGKTLLEYVSALQEDDPRPVSSFDPALRGDVQTILSVALAREKELRYPSAGALAEDLRRYFAERPIKARPLGNLYQTRKFVRRNKVLVFGLSATFLAMVAGLIGTMTQARLAVTRAREAERGQYLSNISLATLACSQDRVFEAEAALLKTPEHLRGWEWRVLWRLSHPELALLAGHEDGIRDVDYSPDGSRLLSVSDDATGRIWDPKAGTCLAVLRGHAKRVLSGRYSPAGDLIATASDDHTARVWTAEGGLKHVLAGHAGPVNKAVFSPDGGRIVTVSDDGTARLWDASTGECLARMEGHSASVWDVTFDRTGRLIATASDDHTARLWDGSTGGAAAVLRGHEGHVNVVRFHPIESLLLTISEIGLARLWNYGDASPSSDAVPLKISPDWVAGLYIEMPRWGEFDGDGSSFVAAGRTGKVGRYDSMTGGIIGDVIQVHSEIEDISLAPRGEGLVVATKGSDVHYYPLEEGLYYQHTPKLLRGHLGYATCSAFHPGGHVFSTGSADRSIRVWPLAPAQRAIRFVEAPGQIVTVRFSEAGELFLLDHKQGLWRMNPAQMPPGLKGSALCSHGISGDVSSDGARAAIADETGEMTLWKLNGETTEVTLGKNVGLARRLEYSPDGAAVLATGPGNKLFLYDGENGALLHPFLGHEGEAIDAAFTPDGTRIVSVSADRTARVWSRQDGAQAHVFQLEAVPSSVCISSSGIFCAVGGADNFITIWSLDSLSRVTRFPTNHQGEHLLAVFSPDSSRLATCTSDRFLKLWETVNFTEVAALPKDAGRVHAIDFSQDGRYLALGLETWRAFVFDAGPPLASAGPPRQHGAD